jgi:hypothetical protein
MEREPKNSPLMVIEGSEQMVLLVLDCRLLLLKSPNAEFEWN